MKQSCAAVVALVLASLAAAAQGLSPEVTREIAVEVRAGHDGKAIQALHDRLGRHAFLDALVPFARSTDNETAKNAVILLATLGDRRAVAPGRRFLGTGTQEEVVDALVKLRTVEVSLALAEYFNPAKPDDILLTEIEILGHPVPAAKFIAALQTENGNARKRIPGVLAMAGAREAIPALREMTKDPDVWVRKCAAEALGDLEAKEAIPELRVLLADPERWVVFGVRVALFQVGDEHSVDGLRSIVRDLDWPLTRSALRSIRALPEKERAPLLVDFLERTKFPERVASELATLNLEESRDALAEALRLSEGTTHLEIAGVLAGAGDERGLEPLLTALKLMESGSPGAEVGAVIAARALGRARLGKASGALIRALAAHPESFEFADTAAWALGRLQPPPDAEEVAGLADKTVGEITRVQLARSEAMLRGTAGQRALIELAESRWDPELTWLATDALAEVGDRASVPFLLEALADHRTVSGEEIWQAALRGLERIGRRKFEHGGDDFDHLESEWGKWWETERSK
ncbi:MAG: HEAT repeat domain-containing protein [Planctomycetes bacterium]|nr:HEAT repeat domain-containing protein [Planctomycetota bacterium]